MDERDGHVMRGAEGKPQLRGAGVKRWTARAERIFFEHLCATCNVKHSARRAGMSVRGAYFRRHADPAFRASWAEALETGYVKLETLLLARAGGTADADGAAAAVDYDPGAHDDETDALDSQLALQLMAAHRAALRGRPRGGGRPVTTVDPDALAETILKRLAAIDASRGDAA